MMVRKKSEWLDQFPTLDEVETHHREFKKERRQCHTQTKERESLQLYKILGERNLSDQEKEIALKTFEQTAEPFFKALGLDTSKHSLDPVNAVYCKAFRKQENFPISREFAINPYKLYSANSQGFKNCFFVNSVVSDAGLAATRHREIKNNQEVIEAEKRRCLNQSTPFNLSQLFSSNRVTNNFGGYSRKKEHFLANRFYVFDIDKSIDFKDLWGQLYSLGLLDYTSAVIRSSPDHRDPDNYDTGHFHIYIRAEKPIGINWFERGDEYAHAKNIWTSEKLSKQRATWLKERSYYEPLLQNIVKHRKKYEESKLSPYGDPQGYRYKFSNEHFPWIENPTEAITISDIYQETGDPIDYMNYELRKWIWKRLNEKFGGDPSIDDDIRVIQIPGYRNPKHDFISKVRYLNAEAKALPLQVAYEKAYYAEHYEDILNPKTKSEIQPQVVVAVSFEPERREEVKVGQKPVESPQTHVKPENLELKPETNGSIQWVKIANKEEVTQYIETQLEQDLEAVTGKLKESINPCISRFCREILVEMFRGQVQLNRPKGISNGQHIAKEDWRIPTLEEYITNSKNPPSDILEKDLSHKLNDFLKFFNRYSGNYGNVCNEEFVDMWWNNFLEPELKKRNLRSGLDSAKNKYLSLVRALKKKTNIFKFAETKGSKTQSKIDILAKFIKTLKATNSPVEYRYVKSYAFMLNMMASQPYTRNAVSEEWFLFIPDSWFKQLGVNNHNKAINTIESLVTRSKNWSYKYGLARTWKIRLNWYSNSGVKAETDEPITVESMESIRDTLHMLDRQIEENCLDIANMQTKRYDTEFIPFFSSKSQKLAEMGKLRDQKDLHNNNDLERIDQIILKIRNKLKDSQKALQVTALLSAIKSLRSGLKLASLLKYHKVRATKHNGLFFAALQPFCKKLDKLLPTHLHTFESIPNLAERTHKHITEKIMTLIKGVTLELSSCKIDFDSVLV
jgi:hypothetical protein